MASKTRLNVQAFPRPPLLEKTSRHLQVNWNGEIIADTKGLDAYWVLETHHPPTYYLPRSSLKVPLTKTPRKTWCEWKGAATYWALASPAASLSTEAKAEAETVTVADRIWSYEKPTAGFEPIRDHFSFYAGPWDCFVDGEKVEPQPGDFYGGWVTSDIDGIVKGRHGNWDPVV